MAEVINSRVRCCARNLDELSIMNSISIQTIQSLLRRMDIDFQEGLPKEAYVIAWQEEFCRDREWVLKILPEDHLQMLLEIWDSKSVEMDDYRWDILQYLRMFGFLSYKKGNASLKEKSEISYSISMRKNFYFFLKSKESRRLMKQYQRWENAFCGLSYYYGLAPLADYHRMLCNALEEEIDFYTFSVFIKCRADLWGFGNFLSDGNLVEYFQNQNVEVAENTLLFIREQKSLPYKELNYEDLEYVKLSVGIDNRWPGVSELGSYLTQELGMNYYRATVLIHTMITVTQNGAEYEKVEDLLDFISFEMEEKKEKALGFVRLLYDNVPVYEYKGHSREEFLKLQREKEWKNRKNRFKIVT